MTAEKEHSDNTKNVVVIAMNHGLYFKNNNLPLNGYDCSNAKFTIVTLTYGRKHTLTYFNIH